MRLRMGVPFANEGGSSSALAPKRLHSVPVVRIHSVERIALSAVARHRLRAAKDLDMPIPVISNEDPAGFPVRFIRHLIAPHPRNDLPRHQHDRTVVGSQGEVGRHAGQSLCGATFLSSRINAVRSL